MPEMQKKNKSNNNRRRCPIKWDGKCDWQGWSDGVSKHIYEAHEFQDGLKNEKK